MSDEQVAVELTEIKTVVLRMESRLFGEDGSGGTVEKMERRIGALEHTEAKARGAFWILSTLFSALGGSFLVHLLRGSAK